eukprot:scaffold244699_cov32-Tisochrysis_lutea.AAC.3
MLPGARAAVSPTRQRSSSLPPESRLHTALSPSRARYTLSSYSHTAALAGTRQQARARLKQEGRFVDATSTLDSALLHELNIHQPNPDL